MAVAEGLDEDLALEKALARASGKALETALVWETDLEMVHQVGLGLGWGLVLDHQGDLGPMSSDLAPQVLVLLHRCCWGPLSWFRPVGQLWWSRSAGRQ